MGNGDSGISGDHRAQLISDVIHGTVVVIVVLSVTILLAVGVNVPSDVAGVVYGSAIGYAAGRAGNVARSRSSYRGM